MKIQIITFADVPDHVFGAEKYFHAEKIILILSDENKDNSSKNYNNFISTIKEITQFYKKLNVPVKKVYVNYKNFLEIRDCIIYNRVNYFTFIWTFTHIYGFI
jgi:hypothetical protein